MAPLSTDAQTARPALNIEQAERAVHALLVALGQDPDCEGLQRTPSRVARALEYFTSGYEEDSIAILAVRFKETYDEMVVLRDVEFASLCEHHLLPFHGKVCIGYLPNGAVVGLSKLARLVDVFARRLQVQERMTQQIAMALHSALEPKGVGVIVEATHLCMTSRGVQKRGALMRTSTMLGAFRESPETRREFMSLALGV